MRLCWREAMPRLIPKARSARGGMKTPIGGWSAAIALSFGSLCWVLLWAGINTGPGKLDFGGIASGLSGAFNGVRAAFPLAVLSAWFVQSLLRKQRTVRNLTSPEALWLFYGLVSLIASLYANPWFNYAYWGLAYISAFAAIDIYMRERPAFVAAEVLNRLSWLMCSAVLLTVVFVARGKLLAHDSTGVSGYGVVARVKSVAGMPMVRASGISRMAAVPGIVAFVSIWRGRGLARMTSAAIFAGSFYLVWVMQSRGSLASFSFAIIFVTILLGGRARRVGLVAAALLLAVFACGVIPSQTTHHIYFYATRGEEGSRLASMSGRTHIFHEAWRKITAAPFIGYGPQADRQFPVEIGNAQNGVLYALLCGGLVGATGYVGGLAVSWLMLLRALSRRRWLCESERLMLLQVAGLMAFFTLRSYPENCAALFSVDLLIQLPAIVYIGELDRRLRFLMATHQAVRPSGTRRVSTHPLTVHASN